MKRPHPLIIASLSGALLLLASLPHFVAALPNFSGSVRSKLGPIEIQMEKKHSSPQLLTEDHE